MRLVLGSIWRDDFKAAEGDGLLDSMISRRRRQSGLFGKGFAMGGVGGE